MPATSKKLRSDRLVARVSREDKALLVRAAALEGASVASFVVAHVREAARAVIREREVIRLSEAESQRFVKALLAPPGKTPARLKRALKLHAETVTEH